MQWEHSYLPVDLFITGGLTIVGNGFLHSGFQVSFAMLSSLLPITCNRSWLFVITVWGLFFSDFWFWFWFCFSRHRHRHRHLVGSQQMQKVRICSVIIILS
jgi:hypothetical protein